MYDVPNGSSAITSLIGVGTTPRGIITGVAKFGFFVELTDIYVEGLVHVSTLAGDYYAYDQGSQCLVGERSGRVYGLGDGVTVQVARVDVDERKVDFEIVSHAPLDDRKQPDKKKRKDKRNKGKSDRREATNRDAKHDKSRSKKGRRRR
ncbi:MAG: S1 RNA-binding domain-containing protein [Gammaproteobacteria bacterium]|nr:S1 RNA-binding domain-containing protein [Gammaproteobacteria bacterium]